MTNRAKDWLKQAEEEMRWVEDGQKSERWAMVCFLSQQVAEKSLTCIAVARGASQIKSHSLRELATALGINGEIEKMSRVLDQYYITTRYPDSFYSGAPYEYFTEEQARQAHEYAAGFLELARAEIVSDGS
ncbi:MAG: HEPN domain-containing protein [Spirochaetota bacterium]